jgi:hypothetical protein
MTKKDLHNQKLVEEANHAHLHFHTRRHFLKESAMGLGALALGSLLGCRSRSSDTANILFDPAQSVSTKASSISGQSESGDLPAHGRGAIATGIIRLQTCIDEIGRTGLSSIIARRKTVCIYSWCSKDAGTHRQNLHSTVKVVRG